MHLAPNLWFVSAKRPMTEADWQAGRHGAWLTQPISCEGRTEGEARASALAALGSDHPWEIELIQTEEERSAKATQALMEWLDRKMAGECE